MEPEFQDDGTIVGQRLLEHRDPIQSTFERRPGSSFNTVMDGRFVPGTEKQSDSPSGWQRPQIAPERRPLAFFIGRRPPGAGHDPARVHPFVQQVGGLAASRRVETGQHDDDRERCRPPKVVLYPEQRLA